MTRPFTPACLAALHMLRLSGTSLTDAAFTLGRSAADLDRACWALVGRSIPEAASALNRPRIVGAAQ